MGINTIRWVDRSTEETEQRVYRALEPFDSSNLPPIYATLPPDVQEYRDTDVEEGKDYYYRISSYRANPELEAVSELLKVNTTYSLGPGPDVLIGGSAIMGFFGEVSVDDFIRGVDLVELTGITEGTVRNSLQPWLKFALDGKILYVAKRVYLRSISWNAINAKGCVYGEKTVVIDGRMYKVRLLKGADTDPSTALQGIDPVGTHNSEWTRLYAPISATDFPSYTGPKYASYTDEDLSTGSVGVGGIIWCQESNSNGSERIHRGQDSIAHMHWGNPALTDTDTAWRPVLELVP